jgi:hypothetical protein
MEMKMAKLEGSSNRSTARAAASGGKPEAAATSTKRMPAPREDETTNIDTTNQASGEQGGGQPAGTETQAAAPAPVVVDQTIPMVNIARNPKREGSKAARFYNMYGPAVSDGGTLTSVQAVRQAGVRGKDVSWDRDRRHILCYKDAADFPFELPEGFEVPEGSTAEAELRNLQVAYLKGLPETPGGFTITDKELIAWGYIPAPAPVVEQAKAEVAQGEANAEATGDTTQPSTTKEAVTA